MFLLRLIWAVVRPRCVPRGRRSAPSLHAASGVAILRSEAFFRRGRCAQARVLNLLQRTLPCGVGLATPAHHSTNAGFVVGTQVIEQDPVSDRDTPDVTLNETSESWKSWESGPQLGLSGPVRGRVHHSSASFAQEGYMNGMRMAR